jgi:hypothetical protein
MPKRVQVQSWRFKGGKKPENTVIVARPPRWSNPFKVGDCREAGFRGTDAEIQLHCVKAFRVWLTSSYWRGNWDGHESKEARSLILDNLEQLKGKDLACYCPLDEPCHADVLLEIANKGINNAPAV